MSIDPNLFNSAGSVPGVVGALSDLDRRVSAMESARTYIGTGTISGTVGGVPGQIVTSSISATEISTGTLSATSALITFLSAGTIETKNIVASTANIDKLTAQHIKTGSITADRLDVIDVAAATVTASTVNAVLSIANTSISDNLLSRLISATNIAASGLSAVTANLGTITAGTITGATFRTSASNPRVVMDATGVYAVDSSGTVTFKADAATGKIITLAGIGGGNLFLDSSFEKTGTPDWVNAGASKAAVAGRTGGNALQYTVLTTGSAGSIYQIRPAAPGRTYTVSAFIKPNQTRPTMQYLQFYDGPNGTGTQLQSTNQTFTLTAGVWTRKSFTAVAPAGTVSVRAFACYTQTTDAVAGESFVVDDAQLEEGAIETAYAPKPDEILPQTVSGAAGGGSGQIVTGTISGGTDIAVNSVNADRINGSSITAIESTIGNARIGKLRVGAVDAGSISVGVLSSRMVPNGAFAEGNPADGTTVANGWSTASDVSSLPTVQTDAIWGRTCRVVNSGAAGTTRAFQTITLPVGRHVVRCWCKTTSATGSGGQISFAPGSATAVLTNSAQQTGTTASWSLLEGIADVAVAGTVELRLSLGASVSATGTAEFANVTIETSVTGTSIMPQGIDTPQLKVGSVTADRISFRAGGRNMIPNSAPGAVGGTTGWLQGAAVSSWWWNTTSSPSTTSDPVFGTVFTFATTAATFAQGMGRDCSFMPGNFRAGVKYTFSCYILAAGGATALDLVLGTGSPGTNAIYGGQAVGTTSPPTVFTGGGAQGTTADRTGTGAWRRVYVTWVPTVDTAPGNVYIGVRTNSAYLATYYVTRFQLEEGDIPTDWTQYIDPTVIDGSTITAATIRTSSANARVQMDSTGVRYFDSGSTEMLRLSSGTNGLQLLAGTSYTAPTTNRSIDWNTTIGGGTRVGSIVGFYDTTALGPSYPLAGVALKGNPDATGASFVSLYNNPFTSGAVINMVAYNNTGSNFGQIILPGSSGQTLYIDPPSGGSTSFGHVWGADGISCGAISASSLTASGGASFGSNVTFSGGATVGTSIVTSSYGTGAAFSVFGISNVYSQTASSGTGDANSYVTLQGLTGDLPGYPSDHYAVIVGNIYVRVAAQGGYSGVFTSSGFTATSDENRKSNFRPFDAEDILDRLRCLPITQYTWDDSKLPEAPTPLSDELGVASPDLPGDHRNDVDGIGPTAQDFFAMFPELRRDPSLDPGGDRMVSAVDLAGVAMAGNVAIIEKLDALEARLLELENSNGRRNVRAPSS